MKINNLNEMTTTANAIENLKNFQASAKDIKRSELDEEIKSKALEEHATLGRAMLIWIIGLSVILIATASLPFYSFH